MKLSLMRIITVVLLPAALNAQSLDISVVNGTGSDGPSTFKLAAGKIKISSSELQFQGATRVTDVAAYGVSPDHRKVGILRHTAEGGEALLHESDGDTLMRFSTIKLVRDDPSLAIYPLNNGEILIRDNIANFTLYDPFGNVITGASNLTGNRRGQSISETEMDDNGNTILVYTPKIERGDRYGSGARVLEQGNSMRTVYSSTDRFIKFAEVTDDGSLIVFITAKKGTDDRVLIMDRYGNQLNAIETNEDLTGARLSGEGRYVSAYSNRRVLVYNTLTGDRVGSTSFRTSLITAVYFPDDAVILGMTGSHYEQSGIMNDLQFHAINLEERSVARKSLAGGLVMKKQIPVRVTRRGTFRYRISGMNKEIELQASF